MRDPKRIREILRTIQVLWEANPDFRLGQLIVVAVNPKDPTPEVFYIEDDELKKRLVERFNFLTYE